MSKKIVRHITTDCCYYTEEDGKTVIICGAHLTPELDGKFWEEVSEYKEKKVVPIDPFEAARRISMSKREFGEPIKRYLIEEDTLVKLIEEQHRLRCGDRSTFEYFWDMMVESGCDQHVSHKEFVEAVENMTFEKLAEMDLALYEEVSS